MSKVKILINTPHLDGLGGVANHYLGLKPYFSHKVKYFPVTTRNHLRRRIKNPFFIKMARIGVFIKDSLSFGVQIIRYRKPTILINPSLKRTSLKRDKFFLQIAKSLGCNVIVFLHGWDNLFYRKLKASPQLFLNPWSKADAFIVLAQEFKRQLRDLGITTPIYLTTTKVDDALLQGVDLSQKQYGKTLLFLARIEPEKGIFTTLEAFKIVKMKQPDAKLVVAGTGSALEEAKNWVNQHKIDDVIFKGYMRGKDLVEVFKTSDIYILPTTHGEGMPTSVLEAMAFGLPVITRPVGGLVDFFEEGKMGFLIKSLTPEDYVYKINLFLEHPDKLLEMGRFNHQYAKKHFLASEVARKLEQIIAKF